MSEAAMTDPAAIEGPPPPWSVEVEGHRQEAQESPSMAWSESGMTGSELFRDDWRGEPRTRDSTHLSNRSKA